MAKYIHYITVPVTTSVNVIVESDEEIDNADKAYDLAMDLLCKANTRFNLENASEYQGEVELGEELQFHTYLNRGNVCHATCPEIYWETEEE